MRLLVISDTHGYLGSARRAIAELGPWDQIVHLGDSLLDAVALAVEVGIDIVAVRGNNEFPGGEESADVLVFAAAGVQFYAVHGHLQDFNGYDAPERQEQSHRELARRAREAGASVALFGHTHQPLLRELEGVLVLNPGGMSLGDQVRTCAAVEVDGPGRVRARIVTVDRA